MQFAVVLSRKDPLKARASRGYKFTTLGSTPAHPQQPLDNPSQAAFPTTAALRCLCIDEVATRVLAHFRRDFHDDRRHRAGLLNVMLTCKALFYPACAALWRNMDRGLDPLLDLLDLVEVSPDVLRAFRENPCEECVSSFSILLHS